MRGLHLAVVVGLCSPSLAEASPPKAASIKAEIRPASRRVLVSALAGEEKSPGHPLDPGRLAG